MRRCVLLLLQVLVLSLMLTLVPTCSDDDGPGPETDGQATVGDTGILPWTDMPVTLDTAPLSCTPGAAGMCNDYKTQYCDNGKCTPCPINYKDCDRKDDCECYGACNGNKCVKGGG